METKKQVSIRLLHIREKSFTLSLPDIPEEEITFGKNLFLGMGFQFAIDKEKEHFIVSNLVDYKITEAEESVLKLEVEFVFHVQDLSKVANTEEENSINIDDSFVETIAGICIGTTRGVLATKTRGSIMAGFPLPILNPKEVLKGMNNTKESKQ